MNIHVLRIVISYNLICGGHRIICAKLLTCECITFRDLTSIHTSDGSVDA